MKIMYKNSIKATTYQCSLYQSETNGMSSARLIRPDRMLKGRGANNKAIPAAVVSVYWGVL